MKKKVIGFLYSGRGLGKEEKMFLDISNKKNIHLEMFNISKRLNKNNFIERVKKCDLVYNNTAEDFVIEYIKTVEQIGKRVIDSSNRYYYSEDKWVFYLQCKEYKIPTPETILLPENLALAREELEEFNYWPVILKRVVGTMGEYVDKANNLRESIETIKKFWKKGSEKLPVIAQEFIKSPSYRVTVIDGKIVQTAIKKSKNWKATGVYGKKFEKFRISPSLRKIIKKVIKKTKMKVCGIDLLKKNGRWLVLEVNSEPALDFFEDEHERLVKKIMDLLEKECGKT